MRIPALFMSLCLAFAAHAETVGIKDTAPDRYTVVRGDTLWDISAKFLKNPWKWPEVWRMNKEQIRNPHLIYPGDVILLTRGDRPQLTLQRGGLPTVKLSPQARVEQIASNVPSIPPTAITPFLSRGGVTGPEGLGDTPRILGSSDERVLFGRLDLAYATGGNNESGKWQIVRQGPAFKDPDSGEVLGHALIHVGEAQTVQPGATQMIRITQSEQEVVEGDRLLPLGETALPSYAPHAPEQAVAGRVVAALGGVQGAGPHSNIVINKGRRDGIEVGHVLGLFKAARNVDDPKCRRAEKLAFIAGGTDARVDCDPKTGNSGTLPERRIGLLFVYRVFERAAYGLVMNSEEPVYVRDAVKNP